MNGSMNEDDLSEGPFPQFSLDLAAELTELLSEFSIEEQADWHFGSRLHARLAPDLHSEGEKLRLLGYAFDYGLRFSQRGKRLAVALIDTPSPSWPPHPRDAPQEVVSMWRHLAHNSTSEFVRARCADLVFTSGAADRAAMAIIAISDYIACARSLNDERLRYLHLCRSMELSTIFRETNTAAEIAGLANRLLSASKDTDSNILPHLQAARIYKDWLFSPAAAMHLEEGKLALGQFKRALQSWEVNEFIFEELVAFLDTREEIQNAKIRRVIHYLRSAESSRDSFAKSHFLSQALQLATKYGLQHLRDECTIALQKSASEPKNWQKVESVVKIPRSVIYREVGLIHKQENWQKALILWIRRLPPAGSNKASVESAGATSSRGGIRDLVTNVEYNSSGYPVKTYSDTTDKFERDLGFVRRLAVGFNGMVTSETLQQLRLSYPLMKPDAIRSLFQNEFRCDTDASAAFAEGVELFWKNDFTAAVAKTIFEVERLARATLILLNRPAFRSELGERKGQFPGLDYYVDELEKLGYDEDWTASIRAVLCGSGLNLRNEYAHGFRREFTNIEAACILQLVGHLALSAPRLALSMDQLTVSDLSRPMAGQIGRRGQSRRPRIVRSPGIWSKLRS